MSIYDTCAAAHEDDPKLLLKCVANWVETVASNSTSTTQGVAMTQEIKSWLLALAGAMVFFMQAGFAMVCAGAIRKKNVNNTMIKNLLDACGAGLAFYLCGFAIAFGESKEDDRDRSTFMGSHNFLLLGDNVDAAFVFFQFAFSATAATIVAGTLAERCKMAAYFAYSFFLTGFVYPVVAHNIWSETGYFSATNEHALIGMGMVDCSGSAVVHITGGVTALYATYILGPRSGRFVDKEGQELSKPGLTKGHSMSLQMLGTMILWFCWYGFNSGSALLLPAASAEASSGQIAARAAINTTLSAGAGTIMALIVNGYLKQRQTGEFVLCISMCMNGCLSGLVAVTAGCGVIEYWAAIIIGMVSGCVYIACDNALIRFKIDDAVSAIPVHLGNGLWGILATGLFATPELLFNAFGKDSHPGLFYATDGANLLPAQIVGALFIVAWTLVTMLPFFVAMDRMDFFRVNELEEAVGLDLSYTGNALSLSGHDEDSLTYEERLAAYRQRFVEKQHMKENKPIQTMSLSDVLNNSSLGMAPAETWLPKSRRKKRIDGEVDEEAPACRDEAPKPKKRSQREKKKESEASNECLA